MEKSKPVKLIILDTETSGLFYDKTTKLSPQILQLGCLVVDWATLEIEDSLKLDIAFSCANSYDGFYWSEDAFKVHEIPKDRWAENLSSAFDKFYRFLRKHISNSNNSQVKFCGWNVKYDIDIINLNLKNICSDPTNLPISEFLSKNKIFDLASVGFAIGVNSSNELCKLLNIDRKSHDALEDCHMCLEFLKFLRGKDVK